MNILSTTLIVTSAAITLTACVGPQPSKKTVLPLDHGPRAQTTPWENNHRLMKAAHESSLKKESNIIMPSDTNK